MMMYRQTSACQRSFRPPPPVEHPRRQRFKAGAYAPLARGFRGTKDGHLEGRLSENLHTATHSATLYISCVPLRCLCQLKIVHIRKWILRHCLEDAEVKRSFIDPEGSYIVPVCLNKNCIWYLVPKKMLLALTS